MDRTHVCVAGILLSALPGLALAQATTNPTKAGAAFVPERQRDQRGHVVGSNHQGWWNDAVFYQILVRSFKDSDSGPLAGDGIGDFPGLTSRLDYLNDGDPSTTTDLGVNAIWLLPVSPSPSYHGYDITDYRGINPQYGTLDDFRAFMAACHKRGIKVLLDLVLNHSSDQSPWFIESRNPDSPFRSWYIWSDTRPDYKGPWGQQVWHPIDPGRPDEGPFYYGLFSRVMPDLNYRSPAVTREMYDTLAFWLDRSEKGPGVDGFRLDAIRHLIENGQQQDNTLETHQWLQDFYRQYKAANPEAACVGEVWSSTEVAARYVGDQMDFTFEFDLGYAMVDAAKNASAARIAEAQATTLKFFPPSQYARFLTNHDQNRVASELGNDPGKLRVAASMLLTGPGVPFIYYAEELGQPGVKPDEDIRTPMPWTDSVASFTSGTPWRKPFPAPPGTDVRSQSSDPDSLLSHYRRLVSARKSMPALLHGDYVAARTSNPAVYAFLRTPEAREGASAAEKTAALVVINLGGKDIEKLELSSEKSRLEGAFAGADVLGEDLIPLLPLSDDGEIERLELSGLKGYSTRVYRLESTE